MKLYAALLAVVILLAGCGPANLASGVITGKDHYASYTWMMTIPHTTCSGANPPICTSWYSFIPITEPERWVLHVHGCDKDGCRDNDVNVSEDVFAAARVGDDWTRPKFAASRSELQPDVQESVIPGVALDLARTTGTAAEVRSGTPRFRQSATGVADSGLLAGASRPTWPELAGVSRRTRPPALSDPRTPLHKAASPARSHAASRKRLVASVRTVAGLRGFATWYGTGGPGEYAAMGGYRDGSRVIVVVTAVHDGRVWSVTLPVVTQCGACRWRSGATLIDLSVPAWAELGWSLGRGVIPVQVSIVEGAL